MAKNNNYKSSDSLWEGISQYASSVWNAWGKDVDEYVDDVMETDGRSDDELYASTVLQDSAHNVELVAHLVGSVFSNDYTKERAHELGTAIASNDSYKSAVQTAHDIETKINNATEEFMQEHPRVQTAIMATGEKIAEAKDYVTQEAKTFAKKHPEITNDLQSIVEIAAVVPAVKAGKVLHQAHELGKMDKIDYVYGIQGRELHGGIPEYVDKKSINAKELAVTAEAKVNDTPLFDVNQRARTTAHPDTKALRHNEIREKEFTTKASNDRKIIAREEAGNPYPDDEIAIMRARENKPNATLSQSHAETAVIQRAYEQGLTQDAHMFIKVNGNEVCGNCNSDTIAMARESGLKSITIHDYMAPLKDKNKEHPVIYWEQGMAKRERYESFEALEKDFPHAPKVPEHIKHAGVIERDRLSMNGMDVALVGVGGILLMNESIKPENTLDQEALEQRVDARSQQTLTLNQVQDIQSNEIQLEQNQTIQMQEPLHPPSVEAWLDQYRNTPQQSNNTFTNAMSDNTADNEMQSHLYDNDLPDSINEYFDSIGIQPYQQQGYDDDMGRDID